LPQSVTLAQCNHLQSGLDRPSIKDKAARPLIEDARWANRLGG